MDLQTDSDAAARLGDLENRVGRGRALEASLQEIALGAELTAPLADILIDRWIALRSPAFLIDEQTALALFGAASLHHKRRLVYELARGDGWEQVVRILDQTPDAQRDRLTTLALLANDLQTLRFETGIRRLGMFRAGADASERVFCETLAVEFLTDDEPTSGASDRPDRRVFLELNRALFEPIPPAALGPEEALTFAAVLRHLRGLARTEKFGTLAERLSRIADNGHFLPDARCQLVVAALGAELMEAGAPTPINVVGMVAARMTETARGRHLGPLLAKTHIGVVQAIGQYTFFSLRRTCATADSEQESRLRATQFARALDAHPGFGQHFLDVAAGRTPPDLSENVRRAAKKFVARAAPKIHVVGKARPTVSGARVAVVLSGQLRSYHSVASKIQALVVEPLQADLFISTWDEPGVSAGFHGEVRRLLGLEISDILPPELREAGALFARFPKLESSLRRATQSSLEIVRTVGAPAVVAITEEARVEALIAAQFPAELASDKKAVNQIKMMYSWRVCGDLLKNASKIAKRPYDIVIRMRPDANMDYFLPSFILENAVSENSIAINNYTPIGVSDQFAYGSQSALMRYFHIFDHVVADNGFERLAYGQGMYGEAFVFDCLHNQGMRFDSRHPLEYNLSSQIISAAETARLMIENLRPDDPLYAPLSEILENDA